MLARPRASRVHLAVLLLGLLGCIPGFSLAKGGGTPLVVGDDQRALAAEIAKEGGPDEASVLATLATVNIQQSILDAMARPAESKPWRDYRPIFVTDKRVVEGVAFWRGNQALVERIAKEYGVPPEIIVAIIGVETGYGRNTGKYRVIDALSTLAFAYPPRAPKANSACRRRSSSRSSASRLPTVATPGPIARSMRCPHSRSTIRGAPNSSAAS